MWWYGNCHRIRVRAIPLKSGSDVQVPFVGPVAETYYTPLIPGRLCSATAWRSLLGISGVYSNICCTSCRIKCNLHSSFYEHWWFSPNLLKTRLTTSTTSCWNIFVYEVNLLLILSQAPVLFLFVPMSVSHILLNVVIGPIHLYFYMLSSHLSLN